MVHGQSAPIHVPLLVLVSSYVMMCAWCRLIPFSCWRLLCTSHSCCSTHGLLQISRQRSGHCLATPCYLSCFYSMVILRGTGLLSCSMLHHCMLHQQTNSPAAYDSNVYAYGSMIVSVSSYDWIPLTCSSFLYTVSDFICLTVCIAGTWKIGLWLWPRCGVCCWVSSLVCYPQLLRAVMSTQAGG